MAIRARPYRRAARTPREKDYKMSNVKKRRLLKRRPPAEKMTKNSRENPAKINLSPQTQNMKDPYDPQFSFGEPAARDGRGFACPAVLFCGVQPRVAC